MTSQKNMCNLFPFCDKILFFILTVIVLKVLVGVIFVFNKNILYKRYTVIQIKLERLIYCICFIGKNAFEIEYRVFSFFLQEFTECLN